MDDQFPFPVPTRAQRRARRENWAIYALKGMIGQLKFLGNTVPQPHRDRLYSALEETIEEVKQQQNERK